MFRKKPKKSKVAKAATTEKAQRLTPTEMKAAKTEAEKEIKSVIEDIRQHKIEEKTHAKLEAKIEAHKPPEELAKDILTGMVVEVSGGMEGLSDRPLTEKSVAAILGKLKEHKLKFTHA